MKKTKANDYAWFFSDKATLLPKTVDSRRYNFESIETLLLT